MNSNTKGKYFLGVGRIHLDKLDFTHSLFHDHREESEKVRSRLLNVFKLEGCRRFDEDTFIDATINETDFEMALSRAGKQKESFKKSSLDALLDPVTITSLEVAAYSVHCLTGLHRVRAAQEYLDGNDQWWVVRLHAEQGEKAFTRAN